MEKFADVIALWGTAESLGKDIGESGITVRAWRNRNSIPGEHWQKLVKAAEARGFPGVTLDVLADIAAKRRVINGRAA